jgi:hypothetical protein
MGIAKEIEWGMDFENESDCEKLLRESEPEVKLFELIARDGVLASRGTRVRLELSAIGARLYQL